MLRRTTSAALVLVLSLGVAACGEDGEETSGTDDTDLSAEDSAAEELPDGVAARVNGTDVPAAEADALFERRAAAPEIAPELEGEDADARREVLRADTLSRLIAQEALLSAAAEQFDVTVSDEELDAAMAEAEQRAGGAEQLDEQLTAQGFTRDDARELLARHELTLAQVGERLAADTEAEAPEEPAAEGELPPEAEMMRMWMVQAVQSAEITVHPDYGTWNGTLARVEPPGGMPEIAGAEGDEPMPPVPGNDEILPGPEGEPAPTPEGEPAPVPAPEGEPAPAPAPEGEPAPAPEAPAEG